VPNVKSSSGPSERRQSTPRVGASFHRHEFPPCIDRTQENPAEVDGKFDGFSFNLDLKLTEVGRNGRRVTLSSGYIAIQRPIYGRMSCPANAVPRSWTSATSVFNYSTHIFIRPSSSHYYWPEEAELHRTRQRRDTSQDRVSLLSWYVWLAMFCAFTDLNIVCRWGILLSRAARFFSVPTRSPKRRISLGMLVSLC
jgi:hypothetical protein